MDWVLENIELLVPAVIAAASAISAFVPSVGKVMRVVDLLALNWGKARNDPGAQ